MAALQSWKVDLNDNITDSESLKFKKMNMNICNNRCEPKIKLFNLPEKNNITTKEKIVVLHVKEITWKLVTYLITHTSRKIKSLLQ